MCHPNFLNRTTGTRNGCSKIPRDRKLHMRKRAKSQGNLETTQEHSQDTILSQIKAVKLKIKTSHEVEWMREEQQAISKIKTNPQILL